MAGGKRVLVVGSLAESLVNFRGDLLRELRERGAEVIAAAPAGPAWVDEILGRWDIDRAVLPLHRTGTNPLSDLRLLLALVLLMRSRRPEIVLAYTIKPIVFGLLAARIMRVRWKVALVTGLGAMFIPAGSIQQAILQHVVRGIYRVALRRADVVLFQNSDDCFELQNRKFVSDSQRVAVIPGSGVNLDRYQNQPLPTGPITFLLIARLLVAKGVREFIAAARELRAKREDVQFHLIGPIEIHREAVTPQEVNDAVISGAIVYHGVVRDVRPHIAACHVFVLPSYYREGVPRTLLEALSIGRPVITTNLPGCRETVVPGVNGSFVRPKSSSTLAHEMERFADLPAAELRRMGEASRKIAQAKFDVRKVNAEIIAALGLDA